MTHIAAERTAEKPPISLTSFEASNVALLIVTPCLAVRDNGEFCDVLLGHACIVLSRNSRNFARHFSLQSTGCLNTRFTASTRPRDAELSTYYLFLRTYARGPVG